MAVATIEVAGANVVEQELIGIGQRAVDLIPIWPDVEAWLIAFAKGQFEQDGRVGAEPWEPLKDSTRARKKNDDIDNGILRARMALFESLTEVDAAHQVNDWQTDSLRFGSDLLQFELHTKGSDLYPPRPIFSFLPHHEAEVGQIMLDYIMPSTAVTRGRRRTSAPKRSFDKRGRLLPPRGPGGRFIKLNP